MTLSATDQQRIVEKESAWIDADQFAPLDLSQFPALQPPPPESRDDGRFAKHWTDTPFNAGDLRHFIENPDNETLSRIAEETNNPDLLRDVRDQGAERVAAEFKARNPSYLPTDSNFQSMVTTLAFNALPTSEQNAEPDDLVHLLVQRGYWTAGNLEACYRELDRQGLLDVPAGQARNLSTAERLRVSRLAQHGQVDEAIGFFLECSLDEEPTLDLVRDPDYRAVCDSAVWAVWEDITHDYTPTSAREAFLRRHCGSRPITLPLLNAAWTELKKREASYARSELLGQVQRPQEAPPVSAREIDAMSDNEVDNLFHSSLRQYAQQFRRAPGVLA